MASPAPPINIGERGIRGTVGIPGTGVSYSEKLSTPALGAPNNCMGFGALLGWGFVALFVGTLIFGLVTS